jgi:hypothetical protein
MMTSSSLFIPPTLRSGRLGGKTILTLLDESVQVLLSRRDFFQNCFGMPRRHFVFPFGAAPALIHFGIKLAAVKLAVLASG